MLHDIAGLLDTAPTKMDLDLTKYYALKNVLSTFVLQETFYCPETLPWK